MLIMYMCLLMVALRPMVLQCTLTVIAIDICLAMSKNHVAPTKTVTLPRLHLMAAVTATRLTRFVLSSTPHNKQQVKVYFWTDSQIVLHWLNKGTNCKPFISN